jgi:hypothetical protein
VGVDGCRGSHPPAAAAAAAGQVRFRRYRFSPTGELGYSGIRGAVGLGSLLLFTEADLDEERQITISRLLTELHSVLSMVFFNTGWGLLKLLF